MSRVYKQQKIPFPTSDKRYGRVWARMRKGDTLEQALADLDKPRKPGKQSGVLKPEKPAETPDTKPQVEKRSPEPEQPKAPENAGNPVIEKALERMNIHLSSISRTLDRIADHLEQHPNVVEVNTKHERIPAQPAPTYERTAGEFREGDKVLMVRGNPHKAFGVGKIVRILPGKEQIKVQFTEEVRIAPLDHFQLFNGGP